MSNKPNTPQGGKSANLKQNQGSENEPEEKDEETTEDQSDVESSETTAPAVVSVAQLKRQRTLMASAAAAHVKVTPRKDMLRVRIAKKWYSFKKDVPVSVPQEIVSHLRSRDII